MEINSHKISNKLGNLINETTDAIVNPANSKLMHGGGAALAISRAGGPVIQEESNRFIELNSELPEGAAMVTSSGNLLCKAVIHVVGPQFSGVGEPDVKMLERSIRSVLRLADSKRFKSVSIPAISSGIFGFPKKLCAEVLLKSAIDFFRENPNSSVEDVVFCNFDSETYEIFENVMVNFFS